MFREIVKDVYIGKSHLEIWVNDKQMPKETLVKDILLPTLLGNKLPDFGTIGTFYPVWKFDVNPKGNHKLFITGIPKKTYDLDSYRLKGRLWSSYYEDDRRGYLFQILPYDVKHLETEI